MLNLLHRPKVAERIKITFATICNTPAEMGDIWQSAIRRSFFDKAVGGILSPPTRSNGGIHIFFRIFEIVCEFAKWQLITTDFYTLYTADLHCMPTMNSEGSKIEYFSRIWCLITSSHHSLCLYKHAKQRSPSNEYINLALLCKCGSFAIFRGFNDSMQTIFSSNHNSSEMIFYCNCNFSICLISK
jgi:hypothetical protein